MTNQHDLKDDALNHDLGHLLPASATHVRNPSRVAALNTVIVLSFNKFSETTSRCLESLAKDPEFSSWDLIVVDNASDHKTRSLLVEASEKYPSMRLILNLTNFGFGGGMNIGMRHARGDIFVLLNSDTVVPPETIGRLAAALRSNASLGLLAPVTNAAGNEQGIFSRGNDIEALISEGTAFANAEKNSPPIPAYRLDFCCVALPRSVYQSVGDFDENFGRGYYEDFDYSLRVRNAGFELSVLEDAFIYHQGSASFKELGEEIRELIARNKAILLAKHGNDLKFPHSRDANLAVLNEYLTMARNGHLLSQYRMFNRLALTKINRPRSWWKRWQYDRRVALITSALTDTLKKSTAQN
ncbi:MAG: glycosyltransferase family 2 protein [Burkholderiales bacterium]